MTMLQKAINYINSIEQKRINADISNITFIYGYDTNIKLEKAQRIIDKYSK